MKITLTERIYIILLCEKLQFKGDDSIKNIANIITASRIAFAVAMVFAVSFSLGFWMCYLCCGLSDFMDGFVARKFNQQSESGAKFDSIADFVFVISLFVIIIKNIDLPIWMWLTALLIFILRTVSYGIGYCKYHTFSSLHTYLNKATGAIIFLFPFMYVIVGLEVVGVLLCSIALLSAIEELVITVKSKELDRNSKSMFMR